MQLHDFRIAPGGDVLIYAFGDYFRYHKGDAGGADTLLTIVCEDDQYSGSFDLYPGQAVRIKDVGSRWRLTNKGTVTVSGKALIGHGELIDNRIQGDVNVVDVSANRALAGNALVVNNSLSASGNILCGFINDGASSRSVSEIYLNSDVAKLWEISIGNLWGGTENRVAGSIGAGKYKNGAAEDANAQSYRATSGSTAGNGWGGFVLGWVSSGAGVTGLWSPKDSIVVPPGMLVRAVALDTGVATLARASFHVRGL